MHSPASTLRSAGAALSLVGLLLALAGCGNDTGGSTGRLQIRNISWGRLVDVIDETGALIRENYVVGEDIISDGQVYNLEFNPVTDVTTVRIFLSRAEPGFDLAFQRLTAGLGTVQVKGVNSFPPYSLVPRNSAMRIQFSGAVDPATVDTTTVQVFSGVPPTTPLSVRYIVDPLEPELLVIDPTITIFDQVATGLPVNSTGLPPSVDLTTPNISLRIPTVVDVTGGQNRILLSSTGSPVLSTGNGPTDPADTSALLRVLRAGNELDRNRGFLLDLAAPRLLGEQQVEILSQTADQLEYQFDVAACAVVPEVGDVIQQGLRAAEVLEVLDASAPDFLVRVRRLDTSGTPFTQLQRGQYVSPYDAATDNLACFLRFTPFATDQLVTGVDPAATVSLRFSEAMDPTTVSPFDSLIVSRNGTLATLGFRDFTIGEIVPSADNRRFTFAPASPGMNHQSGTAETYFLHLRTDPNSGLSIRDLAGNALDFPDSAVQFTLTASAANVRVDGFALRFNQQNEDNTPANPTAPLLGSEWRGQFLANPAQGLVQGRTVARFSVPVDPGQPVIAPKPVSTLPEQTPLNPLGARLMTVWRYVDMGLGYNDEAGYNIDVEGLAWAPFGGQISGDVFPSMEIYLGHSQYQPDEELDATGTLATPVYPNSGLRPTSYLGNVLNQTQLTKVYDGSYSISNLDAFLVPGTGTAMLPWPEFRDATGNTATFTWRDTSILSRGAPDGGGVDLRVLDAIFGPNTRVNYWPAGQVPTIGLPLLMDFRVQPDSGSTARGLNSFQVSFASPRNVQRPNWRVFSAGGFNTQNQAIQVDTNSDIATGGFAAGGAPTPPNDDSIYWGQVDFVIKVSRGVTRWIDTNVTDPTGNFPSYQTPVIEPLASNQPPGTSLRLDFRGADNVATNSQQLTHAECVDLYGEPMLTAQVTQCTPNTAATGISAWTSAIGDIRGKRFLQMRFALVSNLSTGAVSTLSAIGIGWNRVP
ncbi:MAG: Ig-like domain-containing protein [Planctomycetes bacterium]|nr:Ig-like domain-containing protein [Planctomycetota bacterium]